MGVPTIVSVSPADGDPNVYRNPTIQAVFSEALDPETVHTGTFILRNVDVNEVVDVEVSLSSDGETVTVTPFVYLDQETTYSFVIIGADSAATDVVKSLSTGGSLVLTRRILFTSSSEIYAVSPEKTDAQLEAEGDLGLPSDLQVVADTSYLEIEETSPDNRSFAVDRDVDAITVVFDLPLDTSTITEQSVRVEIEAYYPEDEFFLAQPSDDGCCNFQFQENTDPDTGEVFDYSDPDGQLNASGDTVTWTPTTPFPANARVKVILSRTIAAANGRTLDTNRFFISYIQMCPNVTSIESVKDAFFPLSLTTWTDDMIGKTIYKNLMDVLPRIRWQVKWTKVYPRLREYVLNKTVDDIFRMMQAESDLLSGQFKKLGDLVIRYDIRSPNSLPGAQQEAIRKWKNALAEITARFIDAPQPFIKGYCHPEQRQYWRTRLWQSDIAHAYQGSTTVGETYGNSAGIRSTKVAGIFDSWK